MHFLISSNCLHACSFHTVQPLVTEYELGSATTRENATTWAFQTEDQKYFKVLKCSAGEAWTRSVLLIVTQRQGEKEYPNNKKKARWNDHVLHRNCLIRDIIEGKTERSDGKMRKKM